MSSKALIVGVVIVVLVALGLYLSNTKAVAPTENTGVVSTEKMPVPVSGSSNDEIVDYLVDGLSADDSATVKASIDTATVPSQVDSSNSLNTNF